MKAAGIAIKFAARRRNTNHKSARWLILPRSFIFLLLCVLGTPCSPHICEGAVDASAVKSAGVSSNRIALALFRFENLTGDPALNHWGYTADTVFRNSLREIKGLRSLPDPTLEYGFRKLQLKAGEFFSATQAQRLGEMIEAQRVVCGSFQRADAQWQLNLRIINVATGEVFTNLHASSTNWFQLRDDLTGLLLKEVGVTATSAELERVRQRWTTSNAALEWHARARAAYKDRRPAKVWEDYARRVLEADPGCAEGYVVLAASLGTQGKFDAVRTALRKATELNPELARAYSGLGNLALLTDRSDEALMPLKTAQRLDPDSAEVYSRLGELALLEKRFPDAAENFNRALQLSPFQASLHANLARAWLMQGNRKDGVRELTAAEQLVAEGDINTEDSLAWSYSRLNEPPAAMAHYEKLLAAAQKVGLNPKRVDAYEKELRLLKGSLKTTTLQGTAPKEYNEQELLNAIREKLTAAELNTVTNPLAATPQMIRRAQELTAGAKNNAQKARILFDALGHHLDAGEGATRTAAETFDVWNSPGTAYFRCQEYARLYVALARAVGLHAFFVDVTVAYDGEIVSHSCAAIFDGNKLLLVDPSYNWFGIPHKRFEVMDDLKATAEYCHQTKDVGLLRIATKLNPDSVVAHYNLGVTLLRTRHTGEAREELAAVEKLDPGGAFGCSLNAMLALHDKDPGAAAEYARKGLDKWPETNGNLYLILGSACQQLSRLPEAREAYRTALLRPLSDDNAARARGAIAQINEQIGTDD